MKESFRSFHVVFGLEKDSIFTAEFGTIIWRLKEAGMVDKWTRDEERMHCTA